MRRSVEAREGQTPGGAPTDVGREAGCLKDEGTVAPEGLRGEAEGSNGVAGDARLVLRHRRGHDGLGPLDLRGSVLQRRPVLLHCSHHNLLVGAQDLAEGAEAPAVDGHAIHGGFHFFGVHGVVGFWLARIEARSRGQMSGEVCLSMPPFLSCCYWCLS